MRTAPWPHFRVKIMEDGSEDWNVNFHNHDDHMHGNGSRGHKGKVVHLSGSNTFFGFILIFGTIILLIGFTTGRVEALVNGYSNGDVGALYFLSCLTFPFFVAMMNFIWQAVKRDWLGSASNYEFSSTNKSGSGNGRANYPAIRLAGGGSSLDRYQSVMFRLRLAPSSGQTASSLVAQHKDWFNGGEKAASAFFNHPHVVRALDLQQINGSVNNNKKKSTYKDPEPGSITSDLGADPFWGNLEQKAAESVPAADGICDMANCNNEVNAFSFQCFQCRRRICNSCGNSGVLCGSCAS